MSTPPNIPTPDKLMDLTTKHITQTMDVINAQLAEVASVLGGPAPPALPKFTPPSMPKMGGGSSSPFPFALPQLPFMGASTKKGEETIKPTAIPTPGTAVIFA